MEYKQSLKHFKDLTPAELYAIIRLRNEVFVVEQNCVYQDADNKDIYCYHLMFYSDNILVAYARLVPPGLSYEEMSIGRVVTSNLVRGKGVGKLLMESAIVGCYRYMEKAALKSVRRYMQNRFMLPLDLKKPEIFMTKMELNTLK